VPVLQEVNTYYLNCSDSGPTDPDAAWTNDANAFDGSTSTYAQCTTAGSSTTNELSGVGTNAPANSPNGGIVTLVRARFYSSNSGGNTVCVLQDGGTDLSPGLIWGGTSPAWSTYLAITAPSGGWTWAKIQSLGAYVYTSASSTCRVYAIEIEVTTTLTVNNFWGAETEGLEEVSATSGTVAANTANARTGRAAYAVTGASGAWVILNAFESVADAGGGGGAAGYAVGFGFKASVDSGASTLLASVRDGTNLMFRLSITSTGGLRVNDANNTFVAGSTGVDVVDSTYHYIEFWFQDSATGACEVFVDGTSVISSTGNDFNTGTAAADILLYGTSATAVYFDDIYFISGASDSGACQGDAEVIQYRINNGALSPSESAGDSSDSGGWNNSAEVPFSDTLQTVYSSSAAESGGNGTTRTGEIGPYSDTNITGDIVAMKGVWRMARDGGGGTDHFGRFGRFWSGTATSLDTPDLNPSTAMANYMYVSDNTAYLPTTAYYGFIGMKKSAGGQNFEWGDGSFQILHIPLQQTNRNVTGATEALSVTESAANVNRTRDVAGATEVVTLTENAATVDISNNLLVTAITEALSLTENPASINRTRAVQALIEAVQIVENAATVTKAVSRDVVGVTEVVQIVENAADVRKNRTVDGASEALTLTENPAEVSRSRIVDALVEALLIAGNQADVNTSRIVQQESAFSTSTYFNASFSGPDDPSAGWLNDANAFNGSTFDFANTSTTAVLLSGAGLATTFTEQVNRVQVRVYSAAGIGGGQLTAKFYDAVGTLLGSITSTNNVAAWSDYIDLDEPPAGWTLTNVNQLKVTMEADAVGGGYYAIQAIVYSGTSIWVRSNSASVNKARTVDGATEQLVLTENPADINRTRDILGLVEALLITENPATVTTVTNRVVTGVTEAVSLTENASDVNRTRKVDGATEALTLTEFAASVNRTRLLQCLTEVLALTENQADVNRTRDVAGGIEARVLTENQATIAGDRIVGGLVESLIITENQASVVRDRLITALTESIILTQNTGDVNRARNVSGVTEVLTITENQSDINRSRAVAALTEVLTLTENPASISIGGDLVVTGTTEVVAIVENPADVNRTRDVLCQPEVVIITESQAAINRARTILGNTEALSIIENAADVNRTRDVAGQIEVLTLTELAADVNRQRQVAGATEVILITENAATVDYNIDRDVFGNTEIVLITENGATVTIKVPRRIFIIGR